MSTVSQQTITIARAFSIEDIDAEVTGKLALHRGIGPDKRLWMATHVPTGRAFARFYTRRAARAFVADAVDLLDWSRVTADVPVRGKRRPKGMSEKSFDRVKDLKRLHGAVTT